jgi:hypothetical protein
LLKDEDGRSVVRKQHAGVEPLSPPARTGLVPIAGRLLIERTLGELERNDVVRIVREQRIALFLSDDVVRRSRES